MLQLADRHRQAIRGDHNHTTHKSRLRAACGDRAWPLQYLRKRLAVSTGSTGLWSDARREMRTPRPSELHEGSAVPSPAFRSARVEEGADAMAGVRGTAGRRGFCQDSSSLSSGAMPSPGRPWPRRVASSTERHRPRACVERCCGYCRLGSNCCGEYALGAERRQVREHAQCQASMRASRCHPRGIYACQAYAPTLPSGREIHCLCVSVSPRPSTRRRAAGRAWRRRRRQ